MPFSINTNIAALTAYNSLAKLNSQSQKAQLRLASQKRINSVADDTSGFMVGKALSAKVSLMKSAQANVGSAKDMLSTAETQLVSIKEMLTAIKAKIGDAANPASDKAAIVKDIKALGEEIGSALTNTKFNNTSLLVSAASTGGVGGGAGLGFTFQTGATAKETLKVDYATSTGGGDLTGETTAKATLASGTEVTGISAKVIAALDKTDGGIGNIDADVADSAATSIKSLETSIKAFEDEVDKALGSIGNLTQRFDYKDDFLTTAIANSEASVSRLFDADMAMEQLNATKYSIGAQVATSMLGQLNMAPQNILALFR